MGRNDMIDVEDLTFVRETSAAILVQDPDESEIWLPQSQIDWPEDADRSDPITVTMPEWLAEEKGLI